MDLNSSEISSAKVTSTMPNGKKSSKPMMEKKRRARINASLAELKSLVLDAMKTEVSHQHKLEKADILEMTVDHLKQLQNHQVSPMSSTEKNVINKYRLGFNACAVEIGKFMKTQDSMDIDVQIKILNHLAHILTAPGITHDVSKDKDGRYQTQEVESTLTGDCENFTFKSTSASKKDSKTATCFSAERYANSYNRELSTTEVEKVENCCTHMGPVSLPSNVTDAEKFQSRYCSNDNSVFSAGPSGLSHNNVAWLISGNILSSPNITNVLIPLVPHQAGMLANTNNVCLGVSSIINTRSLPKETLDVNHNKNEGEVHLVLNNTFRAEDVLQKHSSQYQNCDTSSVSGDCNSNTLMTRQYSGLFSNNTQRLGDDMPSSNYNDMWRPW